MTTSGGRDKRPTDICVCGDYRSQHDAGSKGRACRFNEGINLMPHGNCEYFIFSHRENPEFLAERRGHEK